MSDIIYATDVRYLIVGNDVDQWIAIPHRGSTLRQDEMIDAICEHLRQNGGARLDRILGILPARMLGVLS